MQVQLRKGAKTSNTSVELNDAVFDRAFNESLVHQVVTAHLAGGRAGTKAQKNRSRVRGGGDKPWRQKGTGRARAGTKNSPIWRGGGRAFAAQPRKFDQKVNRKMYSGALQSILSELIRQERLVVVDELTIDAPKTKLLAQTLKDMQIDSALIVLEAFDENIMLAARNLPTVAAVDVTAVDPVSLIRFDHVVTTVAALRRLEERLQ